MMVLFYCPKCDEGQTVELDQAAARCCEAEFPLKVSDNVMQGREVDQCIFCHSEHLHRRKQFPRRLGIAIVFFAAVSMWWMPPRIFFLPLVLASVLDAVLFMFVPWKVVCYVCSTEYRGIDPRADQEAYDLEKATEHQKQRWPLPS